MNQLSALNSKQTILFDDSCLSRAIPELFSPRSDDKNISTLGRGSVYFFSYEGLNLVLRHYQRGGIVRHFNKDSYLYFGLESTRMWKEFYLLQKLTNLGLPVPRPVAVRCVRTSMISYKGDLITEQIESTQTLAQYLGDKSLDDERWKALGSLLARFHGNDVYHADLNANNILIDDEGHFYLIDFDRCELRTHAKSSSWKAQNLERLLRSFIKQQRLNIHFHFSHLNWELMLGAYSIAAGDVKTS